MMLIGGRHCAALVLVCAFSLSANAQSVNDYPTIARADFIFGCMKVNGDTREAMEKCSCAIDVIASIVRYEDYETASSFMSIGQLQGEKGALFRQSEPAKNSVDGLKRARAEAEVRCF
jgi:hypothetical protein